MDLSEIKKCFDFSDRVIILTGGTGILGQEIACALVGCGAHVAILDRNPVLSDEVMKRVDTACGDAIVLYGDVLDRDQLQESAQKIIAKYGKIDSLINAAGGNDPRATTGDDMSFFDIPQEAIKKVLDLNLLGTIIPCQVFGKFMMQAGEGTIINVSSMNAIRPLTKIPAYSAAKAAINNLTQWLAVHMAQNYSAKIRVNAIAPGFFLTNQNRFLLIDEKTGKMTKRGQQILDHTPMARLGDPEDLLGTILWLLSSASQYITGVIVPIDGGFSAYSGV